jgi:eIF4-gamma/eIF5/eIF2-epsilon
VNSRFGKLAEEERERKSEPENLNRRDRIPENDEGPPPVVNSRFASAADSDRSYTKPDDRGPPLVTNSRFAVVADADRSYSRPDDRGPPPVTNSRFAAAADADRSHNRPDDHGPPPVANSRFAAAADADRSYTRPDDRGPPLVANSRFTAAVEADRSSDHQNRENFDGPPMVVNSRFSADAEADGRSSFARDDRGPPPVANSRFAAAAARAEDERMEFEDRRRERESFYNRDDDRQNHGAIPQNSRFALAAAADTDYVDRGSREQSGSRFGDRGEDKYRRNGQGDDSRGGRPMYGSRAEREVEEPPPPPPPSRVDELMKPKKPEETNIVPPSKEHEANILKIPEKAFKREEESFLAPPTKKVEQSVVKVEEDVIVVPVVSAESMESLLNEFSSGTKLGIELKEWCDVNKPLPPIEKLLFHMLTNLEKLNPDPNCGWAEPSKYGEALIYLVGGELQNQMQVLWAIQLYCEKLGFPKVDGESVVQSMFRAMYKYDLAEADSFVEWKEDESDAHEKGKMTTIIQTMDWFNWLEEDEEVDDEEEEGIE